MSTGENLQDLENQTEPVATEADPVQEALGATESQPAAEQDEAAEHKSRVQRRFDQLTRRLKLLEAENAQYRQAAPVTQPPVAEGRPVRQMFPSEEAYIEALVDHKAAAMQQKIMEQEKQKQREAEQLTIAQSWQKKQDEARKRYQDYDDYVTENDTPVPQPVIDALLAADAGPDIAYYLGRNPDELARISALPAARAAYEIGRIESKLGNATKTPVAAPKPPTVVRGAGGVAKPIDLNTCSVAEYVRYRESQKS